MRKPGYRTRLLIASLPLWVFFTLSIVVMHPGVQVDTGAWVALRMVLTATGLGAIAYIIIGRYLWRSPFSPASLLLHAVLALAFSAAWVSINDGRAIIHQAGPGSLRPTLSQYMLIGVWVYSIIAGASYATHTAERAALAEAHAARSQLSALRAQLNPHFLFNALHAIVQLIPVEPARASQAAERLSDLLRSAIDEDRDLIPLHEELAFVRRYLDMEQLRFGDRLTIRVEVDPRTEQLLVPSFGVHCLVENAVRHGVEATIGATDIVISASQSSECLTIVVRDTGRAALAGTGNGTGLERLRGRLAALFGSRATLVTGPVPAGGFEARLAVPADAGDDT